MSEEAAHPHQPGSTTAVSVYRVELVRTHSVVARRQYARRPGHVVTLFRRAVGDSDREHLLAFYLDADTRFIGIHVAAVGEINVVHCPPGAVFKAALLCNAVSVVLAHNHPSGRALPSQNDIELTHRMELAGSMLDLPVLDHLVIGARAHVSLRETDRMLTPPAGKEWSDAELNARWTGMAGVLTHPQPLSPHPAP